MTMPSRETLVAALRSAGSAHHDYESNHLGGQRDEHWAGWYAAYVLGRTGDFATPTRLTACLESAAGDDWADTAATVILEQLG